MPYGKYTPEEVESRGEATYAKRIRDKVDPEHRGKFLVIDIESGDYEMDADDLTATQQLLATHPHAVIYGLRIGFPTAYRIGAGFAEQRR